MININSGSRAQQMYDVCNEVREAFPLDWHNCITYPCDNKNSMTGKPNSLLQKIRNAQRDHKNFGVGCPCHLVNFCARKGAKELFINFVIDI